VDPSMAGTVTVLAWTGAPPAVAINMPVDGTTVPGGAWVQASATNTADLVSIEFYANSDFIGVATNSPYGVWWGASLQAQYILTAKATNREGEVTWSPSVRANVGPQNGVWGPRRLPTGEMLFFFSVVPYEAGAYLAASDTPSSLRFSCSGGYTNIHLVEVSSQGAFVDESVRGGAVPRRFYAAVLRHDCP
jgi:Bacterial Ig domain